jgi:hypothetical protein
MIIILKRQTSRCHYGSKVPAVTITVFITILEQIGKIVVKAVPNSVNVKNNFTSHIDKQIFLYQLLLHMVFTSRN